MNQTDVMKKILVTNKLDVLANLLTELREKTGKEWTLWNVNPKRLSSMFHKKVSVGYKIQLKDGFTVKLWEMWFGQIEPFLRQQLAGLENEGK